MIKEKGIVIANEERSKNTFHRIGKINSFKKAESYNEFQEIILFNSNENTFNYISSHLDLGKYYNHILFSRQDGTNIENIDINNIRSIIDFRWVNDIKEVNKYFCSVNKLLPDAGIFIGRVETYGERKEKIVHKYGPRVGQLLWLLDFIFNRVIPKIRLLQDIYNFLIQKKTHPISKAEILGRLVYCGFDIIDYKIIEGLFYFIVIKTSEPCNDIESSYHALIKLKRVGKNGCTIKVFKIRTMHPFSEYLQDYVIKLYEYNNQGKPADNFRISRWGKFLRRYWIDEIPQLINILKGEMKIFGCRPVSYSRFKEFPKELQKERIKYKPGIIPPYIALLMPDQKGNIEAEKIYLKDIRNNEFKCDIYYLLRSIKNILLNRIRGS